MQGRTNHSYLTVNDTNDTNSFSALKPVKARSKSGLWSINLLYCHILTDGY